MLEYKYDSSGKYKIKIVRTMINPGIYSITNRKNGKKYIGQSIHIEDRWLEHVRSLKNSSHINELLQNEWNEYDNNDFCFEVLEYCDESELNERERYWILYYNKESGVYNKNIPKNKFIKKRVVNDNEFNLGYFIKDHILENGKILKWVAEKADMNYKTLIDKFNRDSFTAKDLLTLGKVLNIDLNDLKNQFNGGTDND